MRLLSIAIVGVLSFLLASSARADVGSDVVTPENIAKFRHLKVKATTEASGAIRFVVRREGDTSKLGTDRPPYVEGTLRLKGAENVWTNANVVPTTKPDAIEYRFAVAPAHLDIAHFDVFEDDGPVGFVYEIPLKAFAPKPKEAIDGEAKRLDAKR